MKVLCKVKLSPHMYKTPEGYLVCQDAIIARTGKQSYMKSELYPGTNDDTMIDVDRPEEEVFSEKTIASFQDKPLTCEHPDENVCPDNYSDLSVGHVTNVRKGDQKVDGEFVMLADLFVTDPAAIDDIENHRRNDLSCGYDCDITDGPNPKQVNIRGNHVALCECGRAGIARIIDSVKDSIDNKIAKIRVEYDRHQKIWCAVPLNANNEVIGEYIYEPTKEEVKKAAEYKWKVGETTTELYDAVDKPKLPNDVKKQISNYFKSITGFTHGHDFDIMELVNAITDMGYEITRTHIDGWVDHQGEYTKTYYFVFGDYSLSDFVVTLYANAEFKVFEVLAYFNPHSSDRYTMYDSVSKGTYIQEFGKQGDQYKIIKIEKNTIFAEEINTGKIVLFKKDKENIDWSPITRADINDSFSDLSNQALTIKHLLQDKHIPFIQISSKDGALLIELPDRNILKDAANLLKETYDIELNKDELKINVFDKIKVEDSFKITDEYSRKAYSKILSAYKEKLQKLENSNKILDEDNQEYATQKANYIEYLKDTISIYEKKLAELDAEK